MQPKNKWLTETISTVSATGVVTGLSVGSATISYTVSGTCGSAAATVVVDVNPTPTVASISGPSFLCAGSSVTMTDATSGGSWSGSDASVASYSLLVSR